MKKVLFFPLQLGFFTIGYLYASSSILQAQVTSDGTVNTQVNQDGNSAEIVGGETRGGNLFHSFQDFSVGTGNEAFFNNANDIANIFSRVTGGNISNIDGLIRANGSASLFLVNPAGIIFGENARLDIGGSFYGSTASSVLFEDGEFNATDLENPPLLTVNAPIGLGFRDNPGDIVNSSIANRDKGLSVNPGNNISLFGGNVDFDGGKITAPGGKVELGGLSATGNISFDADGDLDFPAAINKANISLSNRATINVRGNNGGAININANNLEFAGASLFLAGIDTNLGFAEAQAGNIEIDTNNIIARQDSQIRNETLGIGNSGDINLTVDNLDFTEGSGIAASSFGQGNAGDINIDARGDLAFDLQFGGINTNIGLQPDDIVVANSVGNAGDINIDARSLSLTNGARLVSKTSGVGNAGNINVNTIEKLFIDGESSTLINRNNFSFFFASGIFTQATPDGIGNSGNITINAQEFSLDNRALISSDSSTVGNAGNITINASENAFFGQDTITQAQIQPGGTGNGGDITINTSNLSLTDAFLLSDSRGRGDAGSIIINASESLLLQDSPDTETSKFREGSLIISGVGILGDETEGNAGNIEIATKSLTSEGSSFIVAQTNGIGDGGDIIIQSEEGVFLNGSSRILSQVQENAVGDGGEINITSSVINLNGLSAISTTTLAGGEGTAGNIILDTNNLTLTDAAIVDALTENNFDGGNITISANTLNLLGGGKIVTATDGGGNAGNVRISVSETIDISGKNPEFEQFIVELSQDEIIRREGNTTPDNRFRFATPSSVLDILGGSSGLFANTSLNSTGNGGNINIDNPTEFSLTDTALISVGSQGNGSAGNLVIESNTLSLENGSLLAATPSGTGGNIALSTVENLELRNQSLISSQATGSANGGNINVDSQFVIAFPDGNNDIIATAEQGNGGNININAESLFGIQQRQLGNSSNDINASSEFSLDGTVTISTPDINPVQGVVELPSNVVDLAKIAQQVCKVNSRAEGQNGLSIIGKGGIPSAPASPLDSLNVTVNGQTNTAPSLQPIETSKGTIQPARGIKVSETGEISLTAYRTNNAGDRLLEIKRNCG